MKREKDLQQFAICAPKMRNFFKNKLENKAFLWIPLECSLLFSDEFQKLCTSTRYIYVAFLLLCGIRGSYEISLNINYLARTFGVDRRTLNKALNELIQAKMLEQRERETEQKEKTRTAQTDDVPFGNQPNAEKNVRRSGADFEDFSDENRTEDFDNKSPDENTFEDSETEKRSEFSLADCLRYAELCRTNGEPIKSPQGLAQHLFRTGASDAFIRAALFPEQQENIEREKFGEPRKFTGEPCSICYGARMADPDGKGFRPCEHCKNERGKTTGFEPENGEIEERK